MKLVVDVDSAAVGSADLARAIRLMVGVKSVEEDLGPEQLPDAPRTESLMLEIGEKLYRYADRTDPFCPLAEIIDEIERHLKFGSLRNERIDRGPWSSDETMKRRQR
jgi:hypothetical protein